MSEAWAKAISFCHDQDGCPSLSTVLSHIRAAIIESGFVRRGRITRGLNEAYRPFAIDADALRKIVEEALRLLLLSGDIDQFTTSAGRGYAATPPRRIAWGGDKTTLLGAICTPAELAAQDGGGDKTSNGVSDTIVRHVDASHTLSDPVASLELVAELGRPEWRSILVELGGADAPSGTAAELFVHAQACAASGERFSLDEPDSVAILSGRSEFFGKAENAPSGRWQRGAGDGCFPATIRARYTNRNVVLHVAGTEATLWQPPTQDIWRWIVVGQTLTQGDSVLRYDRASSKLDFLTPPPRQAERAALIVGRRISAWSWSVDEQAHAVIAALVGCPD